MRHTPPSNGKSVSFNTPTNASTLSPIPMESLRAIVEPYYDESDFENDIDPQSHTSLMEVSFSSNTVKTQLDKMSPQQVIEYLGRKFFPSVVGQDHNLDHTREAIRQATHYLQSIVDEEAAADDNLLRRIFALRSRDSYLDMERLENNLEKYDEEIVKLKESAAATVRNYDESRPATTRQVEADVAAKKAAESLVKRAERERRNLENQIVQRLKHCPSTLEQTVEYIILNSGELRGIYPLYQAIEVFDWLSLTEISSRKKLSPRLESRKIWLQNRVLSQDNGYDLKSRSHVESTEFYEVRDKVKSNIQNLAVDANAHQKKYLSERVVALMKPNIQVEAEALSTQKMEDKRQKEAELENEKQKEQARENNKSQLIRDTELLQEEASKITVKFVRRRLPNRKSKSSEREIKDFNSKLLNRFIESGIDWTATEMQEDLQNLIKAFQVTKYLEARVFNQHSLFKDMQTKVLSNPYPLRHGISSRMGKVDPAQESINDYKIIVKNDFFSRENSPNNIENSINNLSLLFLRDEAYRAEVAERENKLRLQSGVVAKLMEEMRSKRVTLLKLGSALDPIDHLTNINWNEHVNLHVKAFYQDVSNKSSEQHISEILKDQTSIDNRSEMLSLIANTSSAVMQKADELILLERQKIQEENVKKSAAEKRLKREEMELAAQLALKKNHLILLQQKAVENYAILAETIRVARDSYSITTASISTFNVDSSSSSQKILGTLLNKLENLSKSKSSRSFETLIKEHGNKELSKLCEEVFDIKKAAEEMGDSELEKVDNDIEFYSNTADFLDNFNNRFTTALEKFREDKIREKKELREREEENERERFLQQQKDEEAIRLNALANAQKLQKSRELEEEAKRLEDEIKLRIQQVQDRVDENTRQWQESQKTQDSKEGDEKRIAECWTEIWFLRLRHAKRNLMEAQENKKSLSGMIEGDKEKELRLLEEIEKLKIPTRPVNSRSPVKSPNQRRNISEIREQRSKDGDEDISELISLKSELAQIQKEKELLEIELKRAGRAYEIELEVVQQNAEIIVSENRKVTTRLEDKKRKLESQIEELNKKELVVNNDYLRLKQTAVTNLLKILYQELQDIAGDSHKDEIIEQAKKSVRIDESSKLFSILESLGNNPNEEFIRTIVASKYIKQDAENDQFLTELIDIEKVVHEILAAVNRVRVEELHAKNARELEIVREKHQTELTDIGQKLQRTKEHAKIITYEKELIESQHKEEKAQYEILNNQDKIILLLSDASRWSQFPSWKHDDKMLVLGEIKKSASETTISEAFQQVFLTEQTATNKQLAQNILSKKSLNDQKEILAEMEGYIQKISAKVITSEQLTLLQFREDALREKNEIELKIILQANHAALVLNSGVSQEKVKQIVEEIKKSGEFSHNDLFNKFHKQGPDFQAIASGALKDLNSTESREKIGEAKRFIEQIQININALKAEQEKDKTRGIIVDHLRRIHAIVHDENLTDEDIAGLVNRESLIYQNHEEIKYMIIGLRDLNPKFDKDVFDASKDFNISQITRLAQDIDEEGKKIQQEALTKILEKRREEFSKQLAEQKSAAKREIKSKEQEVEDQRKKAADAQEEMNRVVSEARRDKVNIQIQIDHLQEKILTSGKDDEKQKSLLAELEKQLLDKEKQLLEAIQEVSRQRSRADTAESSLEDLTSNLQRLQKEYNEFSEQSRAQIIKLEKEKTKITEELEKAIAFRDKNVETIKGLEQQIENLKSQIGGNESEKDLKIQELQRDLESAQDDNLTKAEEIERLKKNLEDAEIIRKKQAEDASVIQEQLQQEIFILKEGLFDLQKEASEAIQKLAQRISELEQQLIEKGSSDEEKEKLLIDLRKELVEEQVKLQKATELLEQEKEKREQAEAKLKDIKDKALPELRIMFNKAKEEIEKFKLGALQDKEEFDRVLRLMITEKQQRDELILSLRKEITDLKAQFGEDENAKVEKLKELQDKLDKALRDAKEKNDELILEKEKLKQAELLNAENLIIAQANQKLLEKTIHELSGELESSKVESESKIKILNETIAQLEKEKQDRDVVDKEKDVIIAELKKDLSLEREKLKRLEDELSKVRELDDQTDQTSHPDGVPILNIEEDLSIEEMINRFREPNSNGRIRSNWYTSAKIVVALDKINNIIKSFDEKTHSAPDWENIWRDESLTQVIDSRTTLTRGDKEVLTKFALQKSDKYVSANPNEISRVVHVSKQLLRMVQNWESFSHDLISGKTKIVNLAISNPSTSPSPREMSEVAKPSLIRMN